MSVVRVIVVLLRAFLFSRASLAAENLALRHQLGVLQRSVSRPRLRQRDRILWVWLSRLCADWRTCACGLFRPRCLTRTYVFRVLAPDRLRCRLTESELRSCDGRDRADPRLLPRVFHRRAALVAENVALRHQLGVLQRSVTPGPPETTRGLDAQPIRLSGVIAHLDR